MSALRRPWLVTLAVLAAMLNGCGHLARRPCCGDPAPECCLRGGIFPTVVAPYCCDTGIDVAALEKQLHYQLAGGVHGLLVLGTIGEGQYLSMEERAVVITTAVRVAGGKVPVVVGVHTCDVAVALAQIEQARALGAKAVLVKYYGNPGASEGTVIAFFTTLAHQGVLPLLYYHFPAEEGGVDLSPRAVAAILGLPGVIGIKESTLNLRDVQAHVRLTCGQGKLFFSGTALNLTQFMDLGGHGAMCPEAVLLPGPTVGAYAAYVEGRTREARRIQGKLFLMTPILSDRALPPALVRAALMGAEDLKLPIDMRAGFPQARLKAALTYMGVPTPTYARPPLPPLTPREDVRVKRTVERLQRTDWSGAGWFDGFGGAGGGVPHEAIPWGDGLLLNRGSLLLGPGAGRVTVGQFGDPDGDF